MHLNDLENKNKSKTKTAVRNFNKNWHIETKPKNNYQFSVKGIVDSLKVEIWIEIEKVENINKLTNPWSNFHKERKRLY